MVAAAPGATAGSVDDEPLLVDDALVAADAVDAATATPDAAAEPGSRSIAADPDEIARGRAAGRRRVDDRGRCQR